LLNRYTQTVRRSTLTPKSTQGRQSPGSAYMQKLETLSAAYEELLQQRESSGPAGASPREIEFTEYSHTPDAKKALREIINPAIKLVREWGKICQPEPLRLNLQSSIYDVTLMTQVELAYEKYLDWHSEGEDRMVRCYTDEIMSGFLDVH
jgi:hypothetical protein